MNNIDFWKETELYPAMYTRVPQIFDWIEWRSIPRESTNPTKWIAHQHLDGEGKDNEHGGWDTNITRSHPYAVHDYNGTTKELINWYAEKHGLDRWDAILTLAQLCHLDAPHGDRAKWEERQELNAQREQAYNIFYSELWKDTPEAHAVLDYLHGRGWTDDEIREAGLGLVTHAIIDTLPERVKGEFTADTRIGDAPTQHYLVITLYNRSRYFGYKVRNLKDGEERSYLNTKGTGKGNYFYGLNNTKKLVIVEGELDALHAKARGLANVVATTGGSASLDQLRDTLEKGVKKFTLLFDNDDKGREYIDDTIANLTELATGAYSFDVYVAYLPDELKEKPKYEGEKIKDLDDYLAQHSLDDLTELIANNLPVYDYELRKVVEKYVSTGALTHERRDDFFGEVIDVLNSPLTRPTNRETLFTRLAKQQEKLQFNIDDLRAEADRAQGYDRERKVTSTIQGAQRRLDLALKEKNLDEAIKILRETTTNVTSSFKANTFARAFASETAQQIATSLGASTAGVPTGIVFTNGKIYEPLTLNVGLTFVCGSRGHGKTSFLNSLAIEIAKRNIALDNGQSVLYFSYEVQKRRIIADLLNAYLDDINIGGNPSEGILSYYAGQGMKHLYPYLSEADRTARYETFKKRANIFLTDYLASDAIKVVEENYKVEELREAIDYYINNCNRPVSVVCIDYAQLLFSEDYSRARTEEIKRIVNDLKDYANSRSIPFVLACQFNREVVSPASIDTKNIGEGGDYERIADTCIGIYNLEKLQALTGQGASDETTEAIKILKNVKYYEGKDGNVTKAIAGDVKLEPICGKMYARLLKRRNGYYPLDIVLDWTGKTKRVHFNDPEAIYKEAIDLYDQYGKRDDEKEQEKESPSAF